MKITHLNQEAIEAINEYESAVNRTAQCLIAYERICGKLIEQISISNSIDDANIFFDDLSSAQEILSRFLFKNKINIGKKLEDFTREFDRIDDPYIRNYWFDRFQNGQKWPDS